jgi:molybdopterin-guanine dinucleotide biosynthesis protein A
MGQPKAWLEFGGERLLQRIVRRLRPAVSPLVVVGAPGQPLPDLPVDVARTDDQRIGWGPLEALRVGLAAVGSRQEIAFVCGCDAPFVMPEYIDVLRGLLGDAEVAVVVDEQREHPLLGLYRTRVSDAIEQLIAIGLRRPRDIFDRVATQRVPATAFLAVDPRRLALVNINDPDDYRQALRTADAMPPPETQEGRA